jgi:hypothetical protein
LGWNLWQRILRSGTPRSIPPDHVVVLLGAASKDDAIQCIRLRSRRAQASTFQSCEVPQFEWVAYGNRFTGRMYGMTAAVNDQHIFAAGT